MGRASLFVEVGALREARAAEAAERCEPPEAHGAEDPERGRDASPGCARLDGRGGRGAPERDGAQALSLAQEDGLLHRRRARALDAEPVLARVDLDRLAVEAL